MPPGVSVGGLGRPRRPLSALLAGIDKSPRSRATTTASEDTLHRSVTVAFPPVDMPASVPPGSTDLPLILWTTCRTQGSVR